MRSPERRTWNVRPRNSLPLSPRAGRIGALEAALGVRLVPRSQIETDGLTLRCVSAPERCNDAAIAQLTGIAPLIVDAELARSAVTDAGLKTLARFENLRYLDLSHTAVTSAGVKELAALGKLERLNLTADAVSRADLATVRHNSSVTRVYIFESSGAH